MKGLNKLLIIAATHGVEPESRDFALKLIENYSVKEIDKANYPFNLYENDKLTIVPNLNQWGLDNNSRTNENGVDLNRNMPASNWSADYEYPAYNPGPEPASEKENKALLEIIESNKFDLLISLHTTHFVHYLTDPQVNLDYSKEDGLGVDAANLLAERMNLPMTQEFAITCKGSLGSYCKEKDLPCITIEFPEKLSSEEIWAQYSKAFFELLDPLAAQAKTQEA